MYRLHQWLAALALAGLTCLALPVPAGAQQAAGVARTSSLYEMVLKDGTRVYGYIQQETPERITLRTAGGATMEVLRTEIVSLKPARGRLSDGRFLRADPNPTRLFFAPTGRSLRQGEGYIGVYEVVMPFVQVGVTDFLSIGGGTPIYFGGDGSRPFWFTPKLRVYESARTATAIGVLHFFNVDDVNLGIAYAASTIGTSDSAITLGAGWAYANDNENDEGAAVAMFGAEHRLSPRVKLLTENYAFKGGGLLSVGVRFLGESLSADLGIVAPLGIDEVIVFPIVNFVWRF